MVNIIIAVLVSILYIAGDATAPARAQGRTVPACDIDNAPPNCSGMWAVEVTADVPNGAYVHVADPGCMNDSTAQIQIALQAAIAAGGPKLALFSGPISTALAGPVNTYFRNQGGDIGKLSSPYAKNGALCAPIIAVVPADATVKGFRLLAAEARGDFRTCLAEHNYTCFIQWSKFQSEPVERGNNSIRTVTTVFMNWSHDRPRRARLIVFYTSPKPPITQM